MHRPLVALVACLLLTATGLGLLGVAATITQAPVVLVATATAGTTPQATPGGTATPEPSPIAAAVTLPSPGGSVALRVSHLALAPGAVLPPVLASAPVALIAEQGTVGVRTYRVGGLGRLLDDGQADTVLRRGDHLVVGTGEVRAVRNAGSMPAVVLVVAIEPIADASTPTAMVARADLAKNPWKGVGNTGGRKLAAALGKFRVAPPFPRSLFGHRSSPSRSTTWWRGLVQQWADRAPSAQRGQTATGRRARDGHSQAVTR